MLIWTLSSIQAYNDADSELGRSFIAPRPPTICSLTAIQCPFTTIPTYRTASAPCYNTAARSRTEWSTGADGDGSHAFCASTRRPCPFPTRTISSAPPTGTEQSSSSTQSTNSYADGFPCRAIRPRTIQCNTSSRLATCSATAAVISAGDSPTAASESCCWSAGRERQCSGPAQPGKHSHTSTRRVYTRSSQQPAITSVNPD